MNARGFQIGKDRKVCDLPVDHPSCSRQHAVLQYRLVNRNLSDGTKMSTVVPYIIDLVRVSTPSPLSWGQCHKAFYTSGQIYKHIFYTIQSCKKCFRIGPPYSHFSRQIYTRKKVFWTEPTKPSTFVI
jgi:hypothetical protein